MKAFTNKLSGFLLDAKPNPITKLYRRKFFVKNSGIAHLIHYGK